MYTQSRIFVISLAAALTACGGSNQPTSPMPVSGEPVSQPDPASVVQLNSAAETRAFAHEVFEKMAATSRDVIATMPIAKVPCVLGTPDCVLPSEPSNEMVGLDLIAAATDPSATLPGGRAWLRESAPKGQGTTSDGSPGFDQDISTSLSMTRASSLSKSSSSNLLSVTGVNGGAVIVDPLSGTNERRVKLHFTFRNSEYPNGGKSSCSATMVDSQWAITAGHCVWKPTYFKNGYVDSAWVTPGTANGNEPYGRAYAQKILVSNAWVATQDDYADYAWIKLDRPIGAMTGYDGYAYISNLSSQPLNPGEICKTGLAQEFTNQGYPAEADKRFPGQSIFTNGKLMWETKFKFDSCDLFGKQFTLNYPSIGGQSGSAAFTTSPFTGANIVKAIAVRADENRVFYSQYLPLSPQITDAMANSFYEGGKLTGSLPDLMPAEVRLISSDGGRTSQIKTESALPTQFFVNEDANFLLWYHNAAFNAGFNGKIKYRVYLSLNSTISYIDQFIGYFEENVSIGARKNGVKSVKIKVPCPTTSQRAVNDYYYMGVVMENTDADFNNDFTSGEGAAAKIRISQYCGK